MVSAGYNTAKGILSDNRDTLTRIAQALIEREVLDAVEIKMLVEGTNLPPIKPLPSKNDDGVQQVIKPDQGAPRSKAASGQPQRKNSSQFSQRAAISGRPFLFS